MTVETSPWEGGMVCPSASAKSERTMADPANSGQLEELLPRHRALSGGFQAEAPLVGE